MCHYHYTTNREETFLEKHIQTLPSRPYEAVEAVRTSANQKTSEKKIIEMKG